MSNCSICGRKLKDRISAKRGIGPICYAKQRVEEAEKQQELFIPFTGDIELKRTSSGPWVNIPIVTKHSPDGIEWGYGGSGPADLALSILTAYIGREKADELYQEFKWDFVAPMPYKGGIIRREDVAIWLAKHGVEVPGFGMKELIGIEP